MPILLWIWGEGFVLNSCVDTRKLWKYFSKAKSVKHSFVPSCLAANLVFQDNAVFLDSRRGGWCIVLLPTSITPNSWNCTHLFNQGNHNRLTFLALILTIVPLSVLITSHCTPFCLHFNAIPHKVVSFIPKWTVSVSNGLYALSRDVIRS